MNEQEQKIFQIICKSQGVDANEVLENIKCRKRKYVFVRQLFIYFVFYYCNYTKRSAARVFGQEHDYTIYVIKTINGLRETNKDYRDRINKAIYMAVKNGIDMKLMNNYVLVRPIDEGDYVKMKSGIRIYTDPTWKPEDFVQTFVEIIDMPDKLKMGVNGLEWETDIEIRPGDFAWVSMLPIKNAKKYGLCFDNNIMISYSNIYAKVSGGKEKLLNEPIPLNKVIPVNGYGIYKLLPVSKIESNRIEIPDSHKTKLNEPGKIKIGKVIHPGMPLRKYIANYDTAKRKVIYKSDHNIDIQKNDIVHLRKESSPKRLEHEYRQLIKYDGRLWLEKRKNVLSLACDTNITG